MVRQDSQKDQGNIYERDGGICIRWGENINCETIDIGQSGNDRDKQHYGETMV